MIVIQDLEFDKKLKHILWNCALYDNTYKIYITSYSEMFYFAYNFYIGNLDLKRYTINWGRLSAKDIIKYFDELSCEDLNHYLCLAARL